MVGELAVGVALFGQAPSEWLHQFTRLPSIVGLSAQLLAAAMPALRWRP
jgi:hypothetical protein